MIVYKYENDERGNGGNTVFNVSEQANRNAYRTQQENRQVVRARIVQGISDTIQKHRESGNNDRAQFWEDYLKELPSLWAK